MDGGGQRTIRSRTGGRMRQRVLPFGGSRMFPAHDLAETVSGRVRAALGLAMHVVGDRLVLAHTDGFWALGTPDEGWGEQWRLKDSSDRMDVLDPQLHRFWRKGEPRYVVSGVPAELAPAWFENRWQEYTALTGEDAQARKGMVI